MMWENLITILLVSKLADVITTYIAIKYLRKYEANIWAQKILKTFGLILGLGFILMVYSAGILMSISVSSSLPMSRSWYCAVVYIFLIIVNVEAAIFNITGMCLFPASVFVGRNRRVTSTVDETTVVVNSDDDDDDDRVPSLVRIVR